MSTPEEIILDWLQPLENRELYDFCAQCNIELIETDMMQLCCDCWLKEYVRKTS